MKRVTLEILPRPQFKPYLERTQRWACLVVHRRGGKTFSCIQDLILRANTYQRQGPPLRYAYIAPTRDQAKDVAWAYLKDFCAQIPGVTINQSDLAIILPNKASIRLYSGDNYERMRGIYFDGVIIDESADIDPNAWPSVIRPCLSDYQGWATFIGTPKGRNAFYRTHQLACTSEDWFSLVLRASDSGIIPEAELDDIRRNTASPDIFQQEYECDFSVGIPGAIYARHCEAALREGRILEFPWDRSSQVHTSWDLGSPKNTRCIYWQFVGREIHVIDHDANLDYTPAERVAHMLAKGYPYGTHFFPHDAAAQEKSGLNFQQQMQQAGLEGIRIVPRCRDVWPGINKAVELMPRMVFRKGTTVALLEALESYHTRTTKHETYNSSDPVHDWSSHDADAFRMLAEAMLNGLLKGHAEVIREYRPAHQRQTKARAGRYTR